MNKRNNFAISTEGIINAMQSGATVLKSYGIGMEETVALITGANKTLQDPSVVGNGLKSIAINMAGVKADAYSGKIALNKTALALKEIADIDVFADKDKTKIKDMVVILDELYDRWGDFIDPERQALSEAIAGKQQSKVFQSLMSNYNDVLAVREQLANQDHFGSAEAENAQYLDSISGKLNTLKQTWVSILNTFANSESIKGALDVLISVSEAIDSIVKSLDGVGMLLPATFGLFGSGGQLLKNLAGFGQSSYQIRQVGESLQLVSTQASASKIPFKQMFSGFKDGTKITEKLGGGFKTLGKSMVSNLIPSLTGVLSAGLKGLAVAGVFKAVGWAIDNTVNKYKNLDKELQAQADTSKSQLESLNKQKSGLEGLAKEYDELAQKSKKSQEELARFNELKQQIAEISPELVIGYDDENNPILNLNGSLQDYISNLDLAINRQKTLFANDSMEVGKNALDGLKSSWNGNLVPKYTADNVELSKQNSNIVTARQNLVNKLNELNKEMNFQSAEKELQKFAKENEKYNETIIKGHQKVVEEYGKIAEETAKAQNGMNTKLMNTQAMQQASDDIKKLGAQMISAFDLSEVDSSKLDQMIFNMSKNLSSGEFNASLQKVAELRQELEKTYNFKEYEQNIEQYIPAVAKFLGVTEDMARSMLKVPEYMKSSEDALDEFLRSLGKTKKELDFDVEAQNLAQQFYEIENALSTLSNKANLVEVDGKVQVDPEIVIDMQNNKDIPQQIRELIGVLNADGSVDLGDLEVVMDVMTAFKLGNTQQSHQILADVQKFLDDKLGEGKINIKDLKFDVDGKVENVNIDDKELEEKLSVLGDKKELKTLFKTEVIGLDKLDYYAEIVKNLPANSEHTEKFIVENQQALSELKNYKEVKEWIIAHPEVISKYKLNVEKDPELKQALEEFEKQNGKTSESTVKVKEEGADETNKKLEKVNEQADELSKDVNLSVNNGELQGSVESFEKLIEYSTKLKDGTYSISFKSDTSESINQINNLKNAVNDLSGTFSSLPSVTVKIETRLASQNVTGLKTNIEQFNALAGGLQTLVFNTDTTRASKNVTGLKNNVSDYKSKYGGQTIKTSFNTNTERASKNVTGLKNNLADYKAKYGNKTYTTTFNVVTKYSTVFSFGSSGGSKNNKGEPASLDAEMPVSEVNTVNEVAVSQEAPSKARTPVGNTGQGQTEATHPMARNYSKPLETLKYDLNFTTEVEHDLKRIANLLDEIDIKAERAFGSEKIKYLQQQVDLYKQQQVYLKEYVNDLKKEQSAYKSFLSGKGFKFDSTGNIDNYHTKLVAMEKELERLEGISNKEKATEKQKKATENYRKNLEQIKKALSEYLDITFDELPKVNNEYIELGNTIKDTTDELEKLTRQQKLFTKENKLKDLEMQYDKISDKLSILQSKMDINPNSTQHLKEYIQLLEEQKKIHDKLIQQKKDIANVYVSDLQKYGFTFDKNGDISNLEQNLNKYKDSENFEKVNQLVDEYIDLQRGDIPDLEKEWEEINKEIYDQKDALEELERVQSLAIYINKIKELSNEYDKLSDELDIIDVKLKHAHGKEKLDLLDQQIKKLEEQKNKQQEIIDQHKKLAMAQKESLIKYGIEFDASGDITNLDEVLNSYKSSPELEKIESLIDEYISTQRDELPDAIKGWEELESAIKDALKEQLDVTKEVEDKITDIYKKQVEKRIELMEKETEEKIKSLKKQQDEYNKYREEAKYDDEYDEKLESINDLQKQLDIAMKDTSLMGQKRVKELQKLLADAQKDLEKFTQDKIDKNINDMFDKEAERLEEENEKAIENLENEWSDSKIAEMVAQALGSGIFTDIEGNVSSLEDVLINFADETGELFGVLGTTIKSELITNLEIAKNSVKDLSNILGQLDLLTAVPVPEFNYNTVSSLGRSMEQSSNQVNFSAPLININGNVDSNVVEDLKSFGEKLKTEIINTIAVAIR